MTAGETGFRVRAGRFLLVRRGHPLQHQDLSIHKKIAEDAQFIPLNAQQEKDLQAALDKLKAAAK